MELAEQLISGAVNEMVFSKQLISAVGSYLALSAKRYSSCRYNERQLIDVTVVRRVRPRAERTYARIDFCQLIPGTYVSGT